MSADELQAEVYRSRAREYHALVSAEDCDGNLLPELSRHVALAGARVVEAGAGTGRVTRLLVRAGARVFAFDREPAMLAIARAELAHEAIGADALLAVADARALPLASGGADAFIAGWVFGHLRLWMPERWQDEVDQALSEARRVIRAGAPMIVVETLGTAVEVAGPPSVELAEYYAHLERAWGFERSTIRTDYAFATPEDAAACLRGFFGEAMAARIRARRWARVPEHTGVWVARG